MDLEYDVICGDLVQHLLSCRTVYDTTFLDPPDNIGLKYDVYEDKIEDYPKFIWSAIQVALGYSKTVWVSFNARHIVDVGWVVKENIGAWNIEVKPCVQTYTFGQCQQKDLVNNHRPLWRFRWSDAPLFPDAVRVPSWRQLNGDKRADERGKVPSDVFDFPRVTGNSKQRRKHHPTQLNEGLVERCLKLTTPPGGHVLDGFAGTGTTMRVCKRLGYSCTSVDVSEDYCNRIREDNRIEKELIRI